MTGQQMCETIAWVTGYEGDPEDIWNNSPTGELWHVFALYSVVLDWISENFTAANGWDYGKGNT